MTMAQKWKDVRAKADLPDCSHPRLYWCPTAGENECPDCGGFDVCCDSPQRHEHRRDESTDQKADR